MVQRLGQDADSEHRLSGRVQKLHSPFRLLFQLADNAADQIAANPAHFRPGGVPVGKVESLAGSARIVPIADSEIKQRHVTSNVLRPPRAGPIQRYQTSKFVSAGCLSTSRTHRTKGILRMSRHDCPQPPIGGRTKYPSAPRLPRPTRGITGLPWVLAHVCSPPARRQHEIDQKSHGKAAYNSTNSKPSQPESGRAC